MGMEWIVAAILVLVGVIAAVGIFLGDRDPLTRAYKPSISGLFLLGRVLLRPPHREGRDKDPDKGGPGASQS